MVNDKEKILETLDLQARNYATKIVKFCSTETKHPTERYQHSPHASTVVATRLKAFCMSGLGLKDIAESEFNEAVDKIVPAILTTIMWTGAGYDILYDKIGEYSNSYPNSHFLAQFGLQNKDNSNINDVIHEAYYLLCLNDLADHEEHVLNSYMDKENFENQKMKMKSYEISIDSLGFLICAQDAFEHGQSSRWYSAGLLGQEALKEEHEKVMENFQLYNANQQQLEEIAKRHEADREKKAKGGRFSSWKQFEEIILKYLVEYDDKKGTPNKMTRERARKNIANETGLYLPVSTYNGWVAKHKAGESIFN